MGREQGDELAEAAIYVQEIDGVEYERPAYTPADHVNLAARGWVRRDTKPAPEPSTPARQRPTPTTPAASGSTPAGSGAGNSDESERA